jgi:hypothetical protein
VDAHVKIGDCIMRIAYTCQTAHLLCWVYFRDFYRRMCWRYVGTSYINYSIKIDNNRRRVIDFKKEEKNSIAEDLKQIIP